MRPLNPLLCGAFLAVAACGTAADPGNGNGNGNGNTDPTLASCTNTTCSTLSGLSSASLITGAAVKQTGDGSDGRKAANTQFLTTGTWDPTVTPEVTTITGVDVAAPTDTEVFFDADVRYFTHDLESGIYHADLVSSYDYVTTYVIVVANDVLTYSGYHGIATEVAYIPTDGTVTYNGFWRGLVDFSKLINGSSMVTANFGAGTVDVTLTNADTDDLTADFTTLTVTGMGISGGTFSSAIPVTGITPVFSTIGNALTGEDDDIAGGHFYGWDDNAGGTDVGGPDEVAGGVYTSGSDGSISAIFIAD